MRAEWKDEIAPAHSRCLAAAADWPDNGGASFGPDTLLGRELCHGRALAEGFALEIPHPHASLLVRYHEVK